MRRSDVQVEDSRGFQRTAAGSVEYAADFENNFHTRYGPTGNYADYAPAYRYGYDMASDSRYRDRRFEDVE